MRIRTHVVVKFASVVLTTSALFAGCATAPPRPDADNDDGLVRVETAMLDELYVAPNVSLANYRRVMLDPIEVTFKKDWRKDHPEMRDQEFEELRARLADMLREKLVTELARGGYVIAEAPDKDVLQLHATLEDVNLVAPETAPDKKILAYTNGDMTLRVKGFDAPSGALVARARDYEADPQSRLLERADRISANIAAKQIFEKWAEALRSALDVAKVSAGARKPQG
jgi:hypothetical protein